LAIIYVQEEKKHKTLCDMDFFHNHSGNTRAHI